MDEAAQLSTNLTDESDEASNAFGNSDTNQSEPGEQDLGPHAEPTGETIETEQEEEKVEIPYDVEELLEKISGPNPAGIDIESSDVDDAISLFMDLEGEMEKRRDNDYPSCVKWAKSLLMNHSKNLNVAVWLTVSWFRTEVLPGLNKGFILLAELLRIYGEQCFPQGKEKQIRAFSALNNDPRLQMLKKISFEEEKPIFTVTPEILESSVAKELPREILFKITKFKGKSFIGEEQFIGDLKTELFPKDQKKIELIEKNKEKLLKIFRETKTAEISTYFSITDRFLKITESLADLKDYEGIFLDIKGERYPGQERFIDELWQRFRDRKIDRNVIDPYQPLFSCLGNNNIAYLMDIKYGYEHFLNTLNWYFGENVPDLVNLSPLIEKPMKMAEDLVNMELTKVQSICDDRKAQEKRAEPHPIKPVETPILAPGRAEEDKKINQPPKFISSRPEPSGIGELSVQNLQIKRETESIIAMNKALLFYFIEEKVIDGPDNKKKKETVLKVTSDPRIYGISRSLKWNHIKTSPDDNSQTGPNELKLKFLENKFNQGDLDTVIADFESNFINNEELLFWFDGQRYVVKALEQKGPEWNLCAHEIKFHLAKLLNLMPNLSKLTFRDKKTPFASPETQNWIEEEVMGILGNQKTKEKILPPIIGEDYEPINKEYEIACDQLPEHFEENAKKMQQGIAGDLRLKGKFLRKLNLANYCYLAKQYELARILFHELVSQIEQYHIIEWEQALCVAVWQSVYLNNIKLLSMDSSSEQKTSLENENRDLISKISKYDVVLALSLTNYKGE